MIIYVVTEGSYSDYGICALFSTKEKAQKYIDLRNDTPVFRSSDYNIEEYDLDKEEHLVACTEYRVTIDAREGHVITPCREERTLVNGAERGFHRVLNKDQGQRGKYEILGVSYVSAEHALKLAAEGRQAWLQEMQVLRWY